MKYVLFLRPLGRVAGYANRPWRLVRSLFSLSVLVVTAIGLVQFGFLVAAGDALRAAGRAGIHEAVMPRATCRSIAAAAQRRLVTARLADAAAPVRVEINGRPGLGATRPERGDRVVVALSLAAPAAAPDLLGPLGILPAGRQIRLRLAVHIP